MCDQQRLRPASDQSLCWSLEYSMTVKLLTEHHLEFLSLKGGCTGSPESTLVTKPHCWKSHVEVHMCDTDGLKHTHTHTQFFSQNICLARLITRFHYKATGSALLFNRSSTTSNLQQTLFSKIMKKKHKMCCLLWA